MGKVIKSTSESARTDRIAAARRQRLAAFYTPEKVTAAIANWAIRDKHDRVLDPSCGGCAFLGAAVEQLRTLGSDTPERQVFGVDVDPAALRRISALTGGRESQFRRKDFLALEPGTFGDAFHAILGNPPYLRPTRLSFIARERVKYRLSSLELGLSSRASLWAPFVGYATAFLRREGRLAMVLPGALLHTHYGESLLDWLASRFDALHLDAIQERMFEHTDQSSVILYAEGFGGRTAGAPIRRLQTFQKPPDNLRCGAYSKDASASLVGTETRWRLETILQDSRVVELGTIATVRLGIVTGCNDLFVVSESDRRALGIPTTYCHQILRRPYYSPGLWLSAEEFGWQRDDDAPEHLIVVPQKTATRDPALKKWLRLGYATGAPRRYHCRNRSSWYSLALAPSRPEAFFCPMGRDGPRVVVNRAKVWCTNNIFVLGSRANGATVDWVQVALGVLSSVSQLSGELIGRAYGGGILKLEPSEANKLLVPLLPSERVAVVALRVDRLLRDGQLASARSLVDRELEMAGIIPHQSWNALIADELAQLRISRQPNAYSRDSEIAGDPPASGLAIQ